MVNKGRKNNNDNKNKNNKKQKIEEKTEQVAVDEEEEKASEDYCFVCKDGGLLIVCDHKDCVKSYHPDCVGQEDASEDSEAQWICGWHSCLVCKRNPRYQCFCCPNAVCQSCFKDAAFARTRGSKGFCNDCLKLALLGEEGVEIDSDGEKVDFKDRETYEGLFKEYWDIIKEKEGLSLEDLHNADIQIKKGENIRVQSMMTMKSTKAESDSDDCIKEDECIKEEENGESSSDDHEIDDVIKPDHEIVDVIKPDHEIEDVVKPVIVTKTKTKKPAKSAKKRKGSNRIEFVGWASKSVIEFLASIGVDTSKKLSQDDVASLIHKYVQENKLFHQEKRKMVVCDARLRSLLKRRTISVYKIKDSLEAHFLENVERSEDEGYSSGDEEVHASLPAKKQAWWRNVDTFQHKGSLLEKFQQKDAVLNEPKKPEKVVEVVYSRFATINPQNMKLVFLKRSLVEIMLEQFETFESKVIGSFVKVKSEPFNPKRPFQLLLVTGIKKTSGDVNNRNVLLQVSDLLNDVPLRLLSNDDVSEEDCEELRQKIENGHLAKLTVVELEKKAKDLHEDITKFVIDRELSMLKHRIDFANEKGRRAELYEYRRRRDLLQTKEEQLRLLTELPKVTADVIEVKSSSEEPVHNNSSGNGLGEKSKEGNSIPA